VLVFAVFDDVNRETSLPSAETIPTYATTMHWFAMVGEDEAIDSLDLGRIPPILSVFCVLNHRYSNQPDRRWLFTSPNDLHKA
jgi:hypothetical protein